ncbi:MAG: hypothetical protein IT222_02615 [Crocinitomix sp.]|nr:hypothetical protein [Crocinitomix sp.]
MKIVGFVILAFAMFGCQKEHTLPPKTEEEVVELEPYPFNKILGTYSGECIVTEGGATSITDDPDGASSYEDVTTTEFTLEIVKAGLDTIAFLPDSLFLTTPDYYKFGRNVFPIYPTFPEINLYFNNGSGSYSHKASFDGDDLQFLHLKTRESYGYSDDGGYSYWYTQREYNLTKD